ncbi:tyrosine-type recombinase/integrase [Xenorhabdus bovienii]|uniref:tyrosine-type recombinase/integrase n=1 Tax=Xenorhabdus bovienii TaxID=40576 RepID=UPI003DA69D8F
MNAVTVKGLIREWWVTTMQDVKVNADAILRTFEIHVFPKFGELPHDEVKLPIWLTLIEGVTRQSPAIGKRILTYSKTAHRWAVRRGMTNNTPLSDVISSDLGGQDINTDVDTNVGDRTLSEEERVILFRLINAPKYNLRNALIVKLYLLFGCRIAELLKAKVNDFDYEKNIWIIPPANHKTGRRTKKPIIRPIIPKAKELIEQAKKLNYGSEYLFTVLRGKSFSDGSHGDIVAKLNKGMASHFDSYTYWSIHDLRRTMRTGVSELTAPHIAEIMVGHKLPEVWRCTISTPTLTSREKHMNAGGIS